MKTKHFGVFYISADIVSNNYALARDILANVVVMSCEYDPYTDCFKYFGEHPSFPEGIVDGPTSLLYPTVRGTFSSTIDGRNIIFNGWETLH